MKEKEMVYAIIFIVFCENKNIFIKGQNMSM